MRGARTLQAFLWLVLAISVGLYLGRQLAPGAGIYRGTLSDAVLQAIAAPAKLLFLFVAFLYAWRNRSRFEPGNPSRPAWQALALALLAVFLGQLYLARFQLALQTSPFPSAADVFFVASYPLFFGALVSFLRAHGDAGLPVGSRQERLSIVGLAAIVLAALAYPVLAAVLRSAGAPLEKALNVFYPSADLVLLVPTILLTRFSLGFRGGEVWRVWVALLAGIVFLCGGDVSFAYFSSLGLAHLDPVLNGSFLLSYCLLAQGSIAQSELLES